MELKTVLIYAALVLVLSLSLAPTAADGYLIEETSIVSIDNSSSIAFDPFNASAYIVVNIKGSLAFSDILCNVSTLRNCGGGAGRNRFRTGEGPAGSEVRQKVAEQA